MVGLAAELWDAVAVVRYHSFALFHRLVTDPRAPERSYLSRSERM